MDATEPVRSFFKRTALHDYEKQGRGARKNGVQLKCTIVGLDESHSVIASLYKPEAKPNKAGDPRIWLYGLPDHAGPDDLLALFVVKGDLYTINITRVDVCDALDGNLRGPLSEILQRRNEAETPAKMLLHRLRQLSRRGPIASVMAQAADTAVGRALEDALGIPMNSSQGPDFQGIELKAFRSSHTPSKQNRKQLFAKVPDWDVSRLNSMTEVLDLFGYFRDGADRLNCTVSAANINSQGLTFEVKEGAGLLNECSTKDPIGPFATWRLEGLREALANKHHETFWIAADAEVIDGREYFHYRSVTHTKGPLLAQLDALLREGTITMDHMIKRSPSGSARERGPSFKLAPHALDRLFPPSEEIFLT
ncbi:MvaI/BcnI restriction endonuclease family protein [Parvularcula sp. ZS-1/3]|uniref:MvaI/BcnI restriction endonuclease family protein n=1 Tax=Parvularcula mediterranea TaxID=2732508 RepID=A0A7Y3W4C2_9PROT|nr:MvaI/BcnI family restriction endonuclease [Parvularcula mediterranea]NNU15112.1 MvaI/BcnI restriction endonuclease family protein [Parvularcula mediterranea]